MKNIAAPVVSKMFKKIDTNKNGKLEFSEALQVFTLLSKAGHASKSSN